LEAACKIVYNSDWRGVPVTMILKTRLINPVPAGYWGFGVTRSKLKPCKENIEMILEETISSNSQQVLEGR